MVVAGLIILAIVVVCAFVLVIFAVGAAATYASVDIVVLAVI
jgi:hypothetical protein